MRTLRPTGGRWLTQGHTPAKWQSWGPSPVSGGEGRQVTCPHPRAPILLDRPLPAGPGVCLLGEDFLPLPAAHLVLMSLSSQSPTLLLPSLRPRGSPGLSLLWESPLPPCVDTPGSPSTPTQPVVQEEGAGLSPPSRHPPSFGSLGQESLVWPRCFCSTKT